MRNPNKLPYKINSETYDLENGTDAFEIHINAIQKRARILIHDAVFSTGGTAKAVWYLFEKLGGEIV